jgi:hypothetical protein
METDSACFYIDIEGKCKQKAMRVYLQRRRRRRRRRKFTHVEGA